MKRVVAATIVSIMMLPAGSSAVFDSKSAPFPIYNNGGFPDLFIDSNRLVPSLDIATRTFSASSCELVEGSIGAAGTRRLLRFDLVIPNIGNGDLVVGRPQDPNNPYASDFEFSPCHQHYHITGFTDFKLLNLNRTVAADGHKQAFCLEDLLRYGSGASHGYTCGNQGITSGWADIYSKTLSGQWVDITGVPDGDYILRVEINAAGTFFENQNVYNNVFEVMVRLPVAPPTKG